MSPHTSLSETDRAALSHPLPSTLTAAVEAQHAFLRAVIIRALSLDEAAVKTLDDRVQDDFSFFIRAYEITKRLFKDWPHWDLSVGDKHARGSQEPGVTRWRSQRLERPFFALPGLWYYRTLASTPEGIVAACRMVESAPHLIVQKDVTYLASDGCQPAVRYYCAAGPLIVERQLILAPDASDWAVGHPLDW